MLGCTKQGVVTAYLFEGTGQMFGDYARCGFRPRLCESGALSFVPAILPVCGGLWGVWTRV